MLIQTRNCATAFAHPKQSKHNCTYAKQIFPHPSSRVVSFASKYFKMNSLAVEKQMANPLEAFWAGTTANTAEGIRAHLESPLDVVQAMPTFFATFWSEPSNFCFFLQCHRWPAHPQTYSKERHQGGAERKTDQNCRWCKGVVTWFGYFYPVSMPGSFQLLMDQIINLLSRFYIHFISKHDPPIHTLLTVGKGCDIRLDFQTDFVKLLLQKTRKSNW